MEEKNINISEIIEIIKLKWRIAIIITLTISIITSLYSFFLIRPVYMTSIKMFIGKNINEKNNYSSDDVIVSQNLAKTCTELIAAEDLIGKAVEKSGMNIDVQQVLGGLSVINEEKSQMITIVYKSGDVNSNKIIIDSVCKEFIEESKDLMPDRSVKIIQSSKYPIYPQNFNVARNMVMGIIGGLFFGMFYILLAEFTSNCLKTREQVESLTGLHVIGVIPAGEH